ncbi:MAG: Crp/Fnr family transcriptional regulator [Chloroflexi bacterium]|nr:Crp/Fnr family transcriptional regulator [Chloroflexota bacterium]
MARASALLAVQGERKAFDPTKFACLAACGLFQDLALADVAAFSQTVVKRQYRKGETVYEPEMGEVLFILRSGRVELYRLSPGGRKVVVARFGPGQFFGQMPLLGHRVHSADAEASEDTLVCILTRGDVERALLIQPRMALRAMDVLGRRLRQTQDRLFDVFSKGAVAQVAAMLLRLAERGEVALSHQQLADMLGLYRETVTVVMRRLQAEGLVKVERRHIRLLDVDGLSRAALGEVQVPLERRAAA